MSAPTAPRPLRVTRFVDAAPEIARAVLGRIEEDIPEIRDGAWRDRDADRRWLETELRRRLELAERGTGPDERDLDRSGAHFREAARCGAPLPAMQRFLRASVAYSLTEHWARAAPEDVTELLRLSRWMARHNGTVERLLVQAYCEQLDPDRASIDRRDVLAARLLAGVEDRGSVTSAECWLVVVLSSDPPGEPVRGTLGTGVDGRRHLLLPLESAQQRDSTWSTVGRWVAGLGGVRAAGAFCEDVGDIPETAESVRRLLRAAAAVSLPEGLVGGDDLALETALVARPDAGRNLAGLLDALAADERLLGTLVAFFAHDLDRTRTAAALFLSRGGLSLRLDRITQLVGLDPRTTRGIQVLGAALAARALRAAGEG